MSEINKNSIKHLTDLARLTLDAKKEQKILSDLEQMLNYFKELQLLDTEKITPMSGGTLLKNVMRQDGSPRDKTTETKNAVESFLDYKRGYLKVPPIFEE